MNNWGGGGEGGGLEKIHTVTFGIDFLHPSPICIQVWEEVYVTVCGHSFWLVVVINWNFM